MRKLTTLAIYIPFIIAANIASNNAFACDDKACEKAYLSSTYQYISNHGRQANTARTEREAHALNRERRDYALHDHIIRSKFNIIKK